MSFDFPSSPTENQEYTPAGGPTYIYKAPRWLVKGVPGGLPDAPPDGKPYVRKSNAWDDFTDDMALKENAANKGAANGYAPLDASSKVPAINLPAYVDDVVEYANFAAFPATGVTGVIYVDLSTNKVYRWSGSAYTEISPSPGTSDAVPEGAVNLYYTAARSALKANLDSPALTGAPTAPTAAPPTSSTIIATTAFVAGAVSTSAATKANVVHSHAQADVTNLVSDLALKAPLASPALTGTPTAPTAVPGTNTTQLASTAFVSAAVVAAGSVVPSNASPVMDGVANAGVSALYSRGDHVHPSDTSRAPLASPTFTGVPAAPTAGAGTNTTQVATTAFVAAGLGGKLDSAAAATTYAPIANPAFTGDPTAPTPSPGDNDTSIATTAFVTSAIAVTKVTLSDTAPATPIVGSLWYETDTGVLLIYYNDGTSTQWVQIAGSTG